MKNKGLENSTRSPLKTAHLKAARVLLLRAYGVQNHSVLTLVTDLILFHFPLDKL